MRIAVRWALALALTAVGYLHAQLYRDGYRAIPTIGPSFLLLASVSFAIAILVLAGAPLPVRLVAVPLAIAALGGFLLSRTVGLAGFTEHGLQPSPQALESLIAETAVLLLAGLDLVLWARPARPLGPFGLPPGPRRTRSGRGPAGPVRRGNLR